MELQTLSIKNFLPRVSIFARGPFGPLGENGDPREDIFYAYGLQFHFRPPPLFRNYPFSNQIIAIENYMICYQGTKKRSKENIQWAGCSFT